MSPEFLHFADDGQFPNSRLPAILYRAALDPDPQSMEQHFRQRDWSHSWRNGVYAFDHYHSTSHEVLGIYQGRAELCLGGSRVGRSLTVEAGDVLVIPAGVAHRCVQASQDFQVVGAYAEGRDGDLLRGRPEERPAANQRIAALPLPRQDPVRGPQGLWS
ncbi:MAG: cupin domain-containing protein [Candidatus Eremiobacteraeota bacterium]|nr:cupin domain-containing protein [Candidatus Eremiobacteraeota bacterium]MCW5872288.1 cupin domain-containing protein [Candidatus Eremiobacteraeota bacterium]